MREIIWDKEGKLYRAADTKRAVKSLKAIGGLERLFSQGNPTIDDVEFVAKKAMLKPAYYEIYTPQMGTQDDWGFYTYIVKFYKGGK